MVVGNEILTLKSRSEVGNVESEDTKLFRTVVVNVAVCSINNKTKGSYPST